MTDAGAVRARLRRRLAECELERPLRQGLYEPGDRLEFDLTGVTPPSRAHAVLEVERFVGGGFAGQVYRVRLLGLDGEPIPGLAPGGRYAVKILTPPSAFANRFRDLVYQLGYQAPFGARSSPAAVRTGVLWQKLIRRAWARRFGSERAVCDTYATFYDAAQRSFGEINEWVDGRIWKFESDDRLFERWSFTGTPPADHNAPEYVSKKIFMARLVALLHDMGAGELARQYSWWTLKSQPNVLKRTDCDDDPGAGLTAIDFRAGLALLPFLPMSPADVPLIVRGLLRGRLVQFDRGDTARLRAFVAADPEGFADLEPAVAELEAQEKAYRESQPDVTRQGLRLLLDRRLRRSVRAGIATSWANLGRIDAAHAARLADRPLLFAVLRVATVVPFLGRTVLGAWGHPAHRRHLIRCVSSLGYLARAMRGSRIEVLEAWARRGRRAAPAAERLVDRPIRFWVQRLLLGWLPAGWHRSLAEPAWAWGRLRGAVRAAVRFLRDPAYREERLVEQVRLGEQEGMLTTAEAARIAAEVKDPYIQKYLRFLAVHVCTVPVTQVVMLLVGAAVAGYCLSVRQMGWPESLGLATAAAATIQLLPVSPGSLARGLFVVFLMIRERDLRNYMIAAPVSFIHVVGYLAFPLQMVAHNAALARFLAGRWTRNTVHVVPVFGEKGGLLEHVVFDTFFNVPLSVRRGFRTRPVRWSLRAAGAAVLAGAVMLGAWARLWEWRQPVVSLRSATVTEVAPYYRSGFELHWGLRGTRVRLDLVDGPVDFPGRRWDPALGVGDTVDVSVRRSFFGTQYDGIAATSDASPATPAAAAGPPRPEARKR